MVAKVIIFYMLVQLNFPTWCKVLVGADVFLSLAMDFYKWGKENS